MKIKVNIITSALPDEGVSFGTVQSFEQVGGDDKYRLCVGVNHHFEEVLAIKEYVGPINAGDECHRDLQKLLGRAIPIGELEAELESAELNGVLALFTLHHRRGAGGRASAAIGSILTAEELRRALQQWEEFKAPALKDQAASETGKLDITEIKEKSELLSA